MKRITTILVIFVLALCCLSTVSAKNTLVADSGFRVDKDGFSFENYGQQVCSSPYGNAFPFGGGDCFKVKNLGAEEMVRMFGDQVCKSVSKDGSCVLTKTAESWMNQINQIVTNGHCEGMAVLSSLFYAGIEDPKDFGSKTTHNLKLKDNEALQREIAYWFTTQMFMEDHLIQNDPNTQLKILKQAFDENPDMVYPLGIYQRNLSGGHAVTAYAVVQGDNGIYYIMVYDNNYPDQEKYITVDTKKNTWSYQGSTNPWASTAAYSGQGNTNPFQISPVGPRLGTFECDFCQKSPNRPAANPFAPYSPSDGGGYDIWDILSPWLNPGGGSDYDYDEPSQPVQPSQPYSPSDGGGYDIWDILSPWLNPGGGSSSPSAIPFDEEETYEDDYYEDDYEDDYEEDTRKPLIRPTAVPQRDNSRSGDYNRISVNSAVNIYIETDDNERSGYDWENEKTYDEIDGVDISRSMGRSSAKLPNDLKYYLWLNSPDRDNWGSIDATITSAGRIMNLTNIPEAYELPNFVYSPNNYIRELDSEYEFFEVMADSDQLPGVELVISDENGEYSFKFNTELVSKKAVKNANVDFLVLHNQEAGEIGIWLSGVDESDSKLLKSASFDVSGDFTLYDDSGDIHMTTKKTPISLKDNGMFYINYRDWQEGNGLVIKADLDGDGEYETNRKLKK